MPNIFEYTDYRKFLVDYYNEQKTRNPHFSYQFFANKIGFKNKGFIYNIINGSKNISRSSVFKFSQAMNFSKKEAEYFEAMVDFNQSLAFDEKQHFYSILEGIKNLGRKKALAQRVREDQYEFYSKWYYSAIRAIVDMYEFDGDYKWLASTISPPISIKEARKAIELLERIGFIERNGLTYKVVHKVITSNTEVHSLALHNFHLETMQLACDALKKLPREKRNISGLTLGISKNAYEKICNEIGDFQEKILQIAEQDRDSGSVYQLNFHLFPLSSTDIKR